MTLKQGQRTKNKEQGIKKRAAPLLPNLCPLFFVLCSLFFVLCSAAFAAEEKSDPSRPPSVYRIVPPHKSLAASPQFVLIDDFNSPEWKNHRTGIWFLRGARGDQAKVSRPREDARNPRFGSSLKINFKLEPRKQFTFKSSLQRLDMSQAEELVFSCKTKFIKSVPFVGSIRLVLEDWRAKQSVIDITPSCAANERWNEIVLRRVEFKGLDWEQLSSIAFVVVAGNQKAEAAVQFDEIAFHGPNEIHFESNLDNLKGFPKNIFNEPRRQQLLAIKNDNELLRAVAADTWKYFEAAQNREHDLVVDHIRLGDGPLAGDYTSPTNIAFDLMGIVAAEKMKLLSRAEALDRLSRKLKMIEGMRRWRNFYYNFYETTRLGVTRGFISTIDNGWLGIALVVVRQSMDGALYREATKILNRMNFSEFLDYQNNQLSLGFDSERNDLIGTHYGMLISEARAISLFGIGKGDLPEDHWWALYRTPPDSWDWQSQKPKGKDVNRANAHYFQGYYKYEDMKIVPSWGGSLFEFLMPTLVLDEQKLAAESFGQNNVVALIAHQKYAAEKEYPIWGISPAATSNGRTWKYGEYGVKAIAVKGYPDQGVITPHVSFLALAVDQSAAMENIRKMLAMKMYGEYGFYDSVQIKTGKVNTQYLALDQGMSFIAIANFLEDNIIVKLFQQDPIGQKAQKLWKDEKFFAE